MRLHVFLFGFKINARKSSQLTQLHIENVDGLTLGEAELFAHE